MPDEYFPTPDPSWPERQWPERDNGIFPPEWDDVEIALYENVTAHTDARFDMNLQETYHNALFNDQNTPDDRHEARRDLLIDMWWEYGIDFRQDFDWEAWNAWYDSQ